MGQEVAACVHCHVVMTARSIMGHQLQVHPEYYSPNQEWSSYYTNVHTKDAMYVPSKTRPARFQYICK